jgi:hypothetical protein
MAGLFLKLHCDEHFTHAFSACICVFKELTLVDSNQGNYFENATACSKRMHKTTVATQLKAISFTYDFFDVARNNDYQHNICENKTDINAFYYKR